MESILLGAAFLTAFPYLFRLEAEYSLSLAEKQFHESQKIPKLSESEFDYIVGEKVFKRQI